MYLNTLCISGYCGNGIRNDREITFLNIGLMNLEPKYKNLALEKLRLYYSQQGDEVEDYFALKSYDKVYASSIFTFTRKDIVPQGAVCGGSGFDLTTTLPPEIEAIKPHLNFGFTTRGCIRHCPFCIVPEKEGNIRVAGDLLDLWDGKAKEVVVMDNNILAIPKQFYKVCQQAIDTKIRVDFNQGLDHRLITQQIAQMMAKTPHKEYHLAFDHPSYRPSVKRAIRLLYNVGIKRSTWYVLVGYNTTPVEDLGRLNYLKRVNQNAFVQRYGDCYHKPFYIELARWANQHHIFHTRTFKEFAPTVGSHQREVKV